MVKCIRRTCCSLWILKAIKSNGWKKGEQVNLDLLYNGDHQIQLTPTTDIEEKRKPWWKNSLNKVNLFNFPRYCKT